MTEGAIDENHLDSSPEAIRAEVTLGCRVLHEAGLDDLIWGHLAARDPEGRGVWLKPAGIGFDEIEPDDVILVDWGGTRLEGQGRVPIENPIHTELMSTRADISATMHAHATWSIAFMATGQALRPISHDGTWFVPPDIARFTETANLVRTRELGRQLAVCLGTRNAAFMPNHGIVTAGPDVAHAVMSGVLLERACRLQLIAAGGGGVNVWSPDDEALAKREACWSALQIQAGWEYLVRRVTREFR